MAPPRRRTSPSVEDLLFEHPYDFSFFQAVRLLERIYSERQPVGRDADPQSEVVRFSAHRSTAFPPSAVHDIQREAGDDSPATMTVAFLGLTGPQGVLPSFYTEYLIERGFKDDLAPAAFFDLFNHRFLSLFYRAWEKHHFPVSFEREHFVEKKLDSTGSGFAETADGPARRDRRTGLTQYLFDLIGLGTEGLKRRLSIPAETLLLYAGLLAQRPRSACALVALLRDYFGIDVKVEQFRGKWFDLGPDTLSYLDPSGRHNRLGEGAVAGDAIWQPQARFRIVLGPLSYERFSAFLPGGRALAELMELVSFFAGPTQEFDIQLVLSAGEVPDCLLTDEVERPPMLGLSSWFDRKGVKSDANDVIIEGVPA